MTHLNLYELLEDAFVGRLQAIASPNITVVKMPETDADYSRAFKMARVTVAYAGSEFDKFSDTGSLAQPEQMKVMVSVESYRRTGSFGCLQILNAVRGRLLGHKLSVSEGESTRVFSITTASKVEFVGMEEQKKIWEYAQVYTVPSLALHIPDEIQESLIRGITLNTEITVPE